MAISAREYRAIGYYARQEGLKPELSVPPLIKFSDGKELHLKDVLSYYDEGRKADASQRRRKKLEEQRRLHGVRN